MIDFSRTFCDLHPNELITNFCCKQQCNIGLCATCICSHTESHVQRRSAPEYENIRTTYSKMQESIRSRITSLEQQKSRINLLIETIHTKRKNITETILLARQESLELVNRFFDSKEKELLRKVEADQKRLGLHNENRMESLLNVISRDVNSLFGSVQDLNSQNFLESFHRIRTQILANSIQTQKDISDELEKNENYQTNITINSSFISDFKFCLEKSINLAFGEKKNLKITQNRQVGKSSRITVTNNSNNEGSNMTLAPKRADSVSKNSLIIQPRYTPQQQSYPQFSIKNLSQPQFQTIKKPQYQQIAPQQMILNPQQPQNYGSRIEMRPNSSQKNIKENIPMRVSTNFTPSYMENFSHGGSQLQSGKRIKKSGLTIFKQGDNQQRAVS